MKISRMKIQCIGVLILSFSGIVKAQISGPGSVCAGDQLTYSVSVGGGGFGQGSYQWSLTSGAGLIQRCLMNCWEATVTFSESPPSSAILSVTYSEQGGYSESHSKTIYFNAPGVVSASESTVCYGDNVSISVNGISGYPRVWQYKVGNGSWQSASYTNPLNFTNITDDTQFKIKMNTATCGVLYSNTVLVSMNPTPGSPTPSGASRCGNGVVNLSATSGTHSNTVRWYTSSSGGSHFRQNTSYSPNLSSSKTYYVTSYNTSTGCESYPRIAITATINPVPSTPSVSSNQRCGSGVVSLSASPGTNGNTVRWYTSSSGGSHFRQSTTYSPSLSSTTTYYVTSYHTGTGCESSPRIAVTGTINNVPAPPAVTSAQRCGSGTVALNTTPGSHGNTVRWYTASSGGTHFRQSTSYSPSLSGTTTYYVSSYHTTTGCESASRQAITATINPVPAAPAVTEDTRCDAGIVNLSATPGANANTIRWYSAPTGGTYFRQNTTYAPNLSTTTSYYVSSYNSTTGCESSSRVELTATVHEQPDDPIPDDTYFSFGSDQFNFEVSGAESQETYQWYDANDNLLAGETAGTLSRVLYETTSFKVEIIGTYCTSGRVTVTGHIVSPPAIMASNNGFIEDGIAVELSLPASYASYQWYKDGTLMSGETGPTYNATGEGRYAVVVDLSNGKTFESDPFRVLTVANSPESGSIPLINDDPGAVQSGPALNYVRNYTARVKTADPIDFEIANFNSDTVMVTTTYLGGLGRPVQQVIKSGSPSGNDMVQAMVYDSYNRQPREYLPYAATSTPDADGYRVNAVQEQYQFYRNGTPAVAITGVPYSEKQFESSPLNRVIKQAAPGESWKLGTGHETKGSSNTNSPAVDGDILVWHTNDNDELTAHGTYAGGMLLVSHSYDEEDYESRVYKNSQGQVVLKRAQKNDGTWLETYYAYDAFGNLRFVLPPALTQRIKDLGVPFNWANTTHKELIDVWAFQYKYDKRQRMIEKRVPGMDGWIYMIYDQLDRLILSQDPELRENDKWTFTKYDALSRPVITGIYVSANYAALRSSISGQVSHEMLDANNQYTNNALPDHSSAYLLSTTWYDNYQLPAPFTSSAYAYQQHLTPTTNTQFDRVEGQVTASKTRNLGDDSWLYAVNYYDDRYRLIQTVGSNVLGTLDRVTNEYHFNGQPRKTKLTHQQDTPDETVILRSYSYDHADRLKTVSHQLDGGQEIVLSSHAYNELGQLIEKNLHSEDTGTSFAQSVDYRYNIRGWLSAINDTALDSDINDDVDDYFGMELSYDQDFSQTWHNGNISGVKWQHAKDQKLKSYSYVYDALNRIKSADYVVQDVNGQWTADEGNHQMIVGAYDLNGNIESLTRRGLDVSTNSYTLIDELTYDYGTTASNRLMAVADAAIEEGFNDGNPSGEDYDYDLNGNMIKDLNKEITSISYNHLNLPERVNKADGQYMTYIYDAAGVKLAQEVYDASYNLLKKTEYVGEFIYETADGANNGLSLIQHEEGRIVPSSDATNNYAYQYHLKDHLGNTRVTFTTTPVSLSFVATMETENNIDEEEEILFMNLDSTRVTFNSADANSDGGNEVIRVNGTRPMGIGIALPVEAGDTLDMQVNAYYEGDSTYNTNVALSTLISAIAGGFGGLNGGTAEQQAVYDVFDNSVGTYGLMGTGDADVPAAYLNYILFDNSMNDYQHGHIQVSSAAKMNHELLELNGVTASQDGFVYVFLSNESASDNWVYFDDMVVRHTQGDMIIQTDDFTPFGLAFNNGYQRITAKRNDFMYNGFEEQTELDWGVYDYQARYYDPSIGKFLQVDPMADSMKRHSPYNYAFDNPIRYIDPDGMSPDDVVLRGMDTDKTLKQLQSGVEGINVIKGEGGKLSYTVVEGEKMNKAARKLTEAIDDNTIEVIINSTWNSTNSQGGVLIGGAFMGNEVAPDGTVKATNEYDTSTGGKIDNAYSKPGSTILHEITEAYEGAKLSQDAKQSSGPDGTPGNVYQAAHKAALPQAGSITQTIYDDNGNVMPPNTVPANISGGVVWRANNRPIYSLIRR